MCQTLVEQSKKSSSTAQKRKEYLKDKKKMKKIKRLAVLEVQP